MLNLQADLLVWRDSTLNKTQLNTPPNNKSTVEAVVHRRLHRIVRHILWQHCFWTADSLTIHNKYIMFFNCSVSRTHWQTWRTGCVVDNVSKARLLHSLAKCLLELGKRFARIFCEDLVVMALASRFLRCHLPVVTGFRSLISSSRAGINFILPTCQVSFYVFDGKLYFMV